ncbi:NFATC2-interacting protein [Gouania willdenowi]|uniref:NFATC2-interacting protein n=1 Tax=Gouania willdenowi TaxID=441366 RepID=UPI0010544652|nr:NFATC2-interacting protein [Gouania willdenowi]
MAEAVSEGELAAMRPTVSRQRRILDPSAIIPVPVYSNQVRSGLQMKPKAALISERNVTDDVLLSPFSNRGASLTVINIDSEDEDEPKKHQQTNKQLEEPPRCPSPPPLLSPDHKQSRKVQRKLSEIDRKLNSLISVERQTRSKRRRGSSPAPPLMGCDDDVITLSPTLREIPLKVRCGTVIHKIPVQISTPVSSVLTQLSVILEAPPPRLLLLRDGVELPNNWSIGQLGIGITDIIECFVMAEESGGDIITVRLQSKDRDSTQEFSLPREAPLSSVFIRFTSQMSPEKRKSVRFLFDGCKVLPHQTPAQLDMEDGDIIEVWL